MIGYDMFSMCSACSACDLFRGSDRSPSVIIAVHRPSPPSPSPVIAIIVTATAGVHPFDVRPSKAGGLWSFRLANQLFDVRQTFRPTNVPTKVFWSKVWEAKADIQAVPKLAPRDYSFCLVCFQRIGNDKTKQIKI